VSVLFFVLLVATRRLPEVIRLEDFYFAVDPFPKPH
jgi:hypothetical protein